MTGFGKGVARSETKKITIEIKSLNSKQLDLSVRIPSYFREAELGVRDTISRRLQRGKVEVIIISEDINDTVNTSININVLKKYQEQLKSMATELDIAWPSDWYATLLRLPDALRTEAIISDQTDLNALHTALTTALDGLVEFRSTEGAKLQIFFKEKIEAIRTLLKEVEPFEQERVEKIRTRLAEQLTKLESIDFDKGRLEQELIFYIEKLDVAEEKLRLRSHLNYFLETLDTPEPGQGKKLGFIAQEMGREINTLGSKSNNADMQRIVVRMKDELEQIKEQVLNVM